MTRSLLRYNFLYVFVIVISPPSYDYSHHNVNHNDYDVDCECVSPYHFSFQLSNFVNFETIIQKIFTNYLKISVTTPQYF